MKIIYTHHAEEKLTEKEPRVFGITKKKIEEVVLEPMSIDKTDEPILIATGSLDDRHSLCVVFKYIQERILVVTFFPAKKGRYESKILSG